MKIFDDEKDNKKLHDHDLKKKFFFIIGDYYTFFILFLGVYFYYLSLEKCNLDSESECYKIFFPKISELLIKCVFSGFLFSFNYIVPLILKTRTAIIIFCANFFFQMFLFVIDDGTTFQSHGGYNRILFIVVTIIFLLLEVLIFFIYYSYTKLRKIYSILIASIVIFYFFFVIMPKIYNSCEDWQKGLKNTKLNNEINCRLIIPKTCWLNLIDGIFDFSKICGINCKTFISDANVDEFYKNAKVIAFPETQLFNFTERSYRYLQKKVLENVLDISELNEYDHKDFEVVLDRRDEKNPQVKINIKKEYNLIEHKENILKSLYDDKPLVDNILLIFVDAVSRTQFKQRLPNVHNWIEKFYENKTSKIESFQFFKYNSPIPNTQMSLGPVLTGTHPNKRETVNKLIYSQFKEKGFITSHGIDFCTSIPFFYEHNDTNIFHWENFDYEFFSIFCDPNFTIYGKELGIMQGPYSIFRRCLYGKDAFEYVLEFGDKFWNQYKDQKKFLQLSFIDAHELTLEAVKYIDKPLLDFLEKNEKSFLEDNTAIIFLSDHGLHMNGFGNALNLDDLKVELTLPSLFILLPRDLADTQDGMNLKKNENSIISNYDIYNFFQDLVGSKRYSQFGDSLFRNLLIQNRLCDRDLTIANHNCRCFPR